jgi:hypothetical protein
MSHYDNCRESAKWVELKREAYDLYATELNQLGSAVELIKALANGYGEDGSEKHDGFYATTTPRQACDRWLQDNGYECESSRAAQRDIKLAKINAEIDRLQKEKEAL